MILDRIDLVARTLTTRLDHMDADRSAARVDRAERDHGMIEAIDALTEKVGVQNGRVGKLELFVHGFNAVKESRSWRFPAIVALLVGVTVGTTGTVIALVIQHAST
jgi:hypothetical protein